MLAHASRQATCCIIALDAIRLHERTYLHKEHCKLPKDQHSSCRSDMCPGCTAAQGARAWARPHRQTSVPPNHCLRLPCTAPACWLCHPHIWQCSCSRGCIPSEALCIRYPCVQKRPTWHGLMLYEEKPKVFLGCPVPCPTIQNDEQLLGAG